MSDDLRRLADDAIRQQIAAKVLEGIGSEHRDVILRRSIEDALKEYSFQRSVEECVAKDAARVAGEMLRSDHWQLRLRTAVEETLNSLCSRLSHALMEALVEAVAGKESLSSYDRGPGLIAKFLRKQP